MENMKLAGIVFCLSLLIFSSMSCSSQLGASKNSVELHVSPDGKDSNPGTLAKPFKTLHHAQQFIKESKLNGNKKVTIYLHEGVYALDKSLKFTAEDSGSKAFPVVYTAYQDQTVKIIGGKELPKKWFTPVHDPAILERIICPNSRKVVLSVNLHDRNIRNYGKMSLRGFPDHDPDMPQGQKKEKASMELFYNGQRQTIARWPNAGKLYPTTVIDPGPTWDWDEDDTPEFWQRGGTFRFASKDSDTWRPEKWQKADDIWTEGILSKAWVWNFNKVEKIDPEKKVITLRYGVFEGGILAADASKQDKRYFHFVNLLEEIDQPGEYYLDRNTGILYVYPPEGWDESDTGFEISLLADPVLDFDKAENITIQGLIVESGRDFGVRCMNTRNIGIDQCEIRNFTTGGMYIDAYQTQITNTHIHHTGGTAIHLLGGDFETLTPSGNIMSNCEIDHFGYWDRVYYPGITLRGVGQHITNCLIHDGPHMGMMIYGNDHLIEYNEFHSVPNEFRDIAAIYVNLGERVAERGIVIKRNYFHDIGLGDDIGKQAAVYFDSSTNAMTVEGNLFYNVGTVNNDWSVMVHGGSYNKITNNVFVDCTKPYFTAFWLTSWGKSWIPWYEKRWKALFEKYDFANMPHGKKYPELLRFLEEDRLAPDNNVFSGNLIYNPNKAVKGNPISISYKDKSVLIQENNWIASEDPGFKNASKRDFRFEEDAKVFEKIPGFEDIHFEKMGLKK